MRVSRTVAVHAAVVLFLSSCSSSTNEAVAARLQNDVVTATTDVTPVDSELLDDSTVTEEEIIAAELAGRRDDVAVRLIEAEPVRAGGSSTLVVEVFGVLGSAGDGLVSLPSLSVVPSPGVTLTSVREGCTITDLGVDCVADAPLLQGAGSTTETDSLVFEFEYSVSSNAALPVKFELEASSFENPALSDPDPSNNVLTVETLTAG